jgi:hypothetical protein
MAAMQYNFKKITHVRPRATRRARVASPRLASRAAREICGRLSAAAAFPPSVRFVR